jgi:hypothetical protein
MIGTVVRESATVEEATWENEDFLHSRHPDFELPQ